MAIKDTNGKIAYIYDQATNKWYAISGAINTAASYTWTGTQTFTNTVIATDVIHAKAGVNNFLNPTLRDSAIQSPINGLVVFLRQDSSGNTVNRLQYYFNGSWRWIDDAVLFTPQTKTSSFTIDIDQPGTTVKVNSSSPINITVPPNSSVPFAIGHKIDFYRLGSGDVTFVEGSGVTINSKNSSKQIIFQYGVATLTKLDTNTWILTGDLVSTGGSTPTTPTPTATTTSSPTPTATTTSTVVPSYNVVYNCNGGTGCPSNTTHNGSYVIPNTVPTRSGYTFNDYVVSSSSCTFPSTVPNALRGETITCSGDISLSAQWLLPTPTTTVVTPTTTVVTPTTTSTTAVTPTTTTTSPTVTFSSLVPTTTTTATAAPVINSMTESSDCTTITIQWTGSNYQSYAVTNSTGWTDPVYGNGLGGSVTLTVGTCGTSKTATLRLYSGLNQTGTQVSQAFTIITTSCAICNAPTTTTTAVTPTTTTTTTTTTTSAPYWYTGCCSTTGSQVTGTSQTNFGEAYTGMTNQCSGTVTNQQSGNYGTIPSLSCPAPVTPTTTTTSTAVTPTTTTTTSAQVEYYIGTSICNANTGYYVSAPAAAGPYYAASMPADVISGPSTSREKTVYRSTYAEALSAAENASCVVAPATTTTTPTTTTTAVTPTTTTTAQTWYCSTTDLGPDGMYQGTWNADVSSEQCGVYKTVCQLGSYPPYPSVPQCPTTTTAVTPTTTTTSAAVTPTTTTTSAVVTPTTTTTTTGYPPLLSGYHLCTPEDVPNPSSPCTAAGQCKLDGASGAACSAGSCANPGLVYSIGGTATCDSGCVETSSGSGTGGGSNITTPCGTFYAVQGVPYSWKCCNNA